MEFENAEITDELRTDFFPRFNHTKILTQRRKDAEKNLAWRGPALFHQIKQVRERFGVSAAFLFGQLFGAFVQLGGHFGRFLGRTPERDEGFGQFRNFHGKKLPRIHTDKHR